MGKGNRRELQFSEVLQETSPGVNALALCFDDITLLACCAFVDVVQSVDSAPTRMGTMEDKTTLANISQNQVAPSRSFAPSPTFGPGASQLSFCGAAD